MRQIISLLSLIIFFFTSSEALSMENVGRLGLGMSNQLKSEMPSLSFKVLKSRTFGLGGLVGASTSDQSGGWGAGLKLYRNLFEEPNLNFYMSALAGLVKKKIAGVSKTGPQLDLTFGSEFSFSGLESIGFSFEFGVSANKIDEFTFETVGQHFIAAGIHFYI